MPFSRAHGVLIYASFDLCFNRYASAQNGRRSFAVDQASTSSCTSADYLLWARVTKSVPDVIPPVKDADLCVLAALCRLTRHMFPTSPHAIQMRLSVRRKLPRDTEFGSEIILSRPRGDIFATSDSTVRTTMDVMQPRVPHKNDISTPCYRAARPAKPHHHQRTRTIDRL